MKKLTLIALLVLPIAGCGDDDEQPTANTTEPAPEPEPVPDPTPRVPEDPSVFVAPEAPENGCRFGEPSTAWERPGWFDIAQTSRGFLLAGSASHGTYEMAFVATVSSGGGTHVVARTRLEHPVAEGHRRAPPALAAEGDHGAVALVDGQQRLLVARFDPRDAGALNFAVAVENASLRFSPALLRHDDAWWIAWTEERGDSGRRVFGARIPDRGDMSEPQDLTPSTGGAAAPVFVDGADPPELIFLDAREGISVVHRAGIAGERFTATEVARPVSAVTDPPQIAAVQIGGSRFLGYTGIGAAATTAVGFMPLAGTDAPTPMVPGTGYGILHVDVAPLGEGAVLVADAPLESEPTAPRELQVRVVSATGAMSEATVVRGPSESTSRGRVASLEGVIAVAFRSEAGIHVSIGRCAGD